MTVLRTGGHPRNGPGTDGDVHQRVLSILAGLLPAMIGVGVPGFSFENDLTFVPRLPEARVPVYTRGSPGRPGTACSATSACRSPPAGALRRSAAGSISFCVAQGPDIVLMLDRGRPSV